MCWIFLNITLQMVAESHLLTCRYDRNCCNYLSRRQPRLVTNQTMWPHAIHNYVGLWPRICYHGIQNCCGLWPQQTVTTFASKIPPIFKEMVTKINVYVIQECCGLQPQQTVTTSAGKIPLIFKEMVTKINVCNSGMLLPLSTTNCDHPRLQNSNVI